MQPQAGGLPDAARIGINPGGGTDRAQQKPGKAGLLMGNRKHNPDRTGQLKDGMITKIEAMHKSPLTLSRKRGVCMCDSINPGVLL